MKERIKGAFTKRKILHFLKMALFVVALSLILLSLLGTVAHAAGLVDDTVSADNLYSKYPLQNYTLDFYVDNSWGWLPWNWLDAVSYTHLNGKLHQKYTGAVKEVSQWKTSRGGNPQD